MASLFTKKLTYLVIFTFCNLALFSLSSTFHNLIGYDLNTLEEWLYHNRLFLISLSKLITLLLLLLLPNLYFIKAETFKNYLNLMKLNIKRTWKIDNKKWIFHFFSVVVLYSFFFNLQIVDQVEFNIKEFNNFILCLVFWMSDVVFVRSLYKNNIFINLKYHTLLNSSLQALLVASTTAIVTYLPWSDQLQFFLVLCCVFYLMQIESTKFSGYAIMISIFSIMALVRPFNFITNLDESKFYLIADNFSLPWSFIFVLYFLVYYRFSPFMDEIYKFLFFRSPKVK
jgi:hypothetical protein